MTSVAYTVCSHTNPEQVARLVSVISADDRGSSVVVHHDDSRSRLDARALRERFGVNVLRSDESVEWGAFSVVEMVLRCMRWALETLQFEWLVLLSGQDYPIRPLRAIEESLASSEFDGFLSGRTVEALKPRSAREARRRYQYRYYRLPTPRRLVVAGLSARHRTRSGGHRQTGEMNGAEDTSPISIRAVPDGSALYVGVPRRHTPFGPSFQCFRGSGWFTLSIKSVRAVDRFIDEHPEYVRFYRRTWVPDESFFNTILLNDPELNISTDDRRYVRFPPEGAPHPDVLAIDDLEPMLASGKDFARKFDTRIDSAILDALDERVHGIRQSIT